MSTSPNGKAATSSSTIFVVDDEPMLLDLAAAVLQPLGFKVQVFSDPKKALLELPSARPAVVVSDYSMGAMNGLEFIRECRRINPGQKILLLSGTVDEAIYDGSAVKPNRFLSKPYQIPDFIATVQELLAS